MACGRAVVATRLRWPDRADALLRRLRALTMAGHLLDDSDTLELAAEQADLPVAEIAAYCAEPEVEDALRADMRSARSPSPASRAQDYKLGGRPEERRYTCPSYELLAGDARVDLPGYRPIEAYETALANLEPALTRRPDPESVGEVLAWGEGRFASPRAAVRSWLLSPPHRRVLLGRNYRDVGVGIALGSPFGGSMRSSATYAAEFGA